MVRPPLFAASDVTLPKLAPEIFEFGLANAGVLVTLKASARSWNLRLSQMLNSRTTLASKLNRPGPRSIFRDEVPKRGVPVTAAKAVVSKYAGRPATLLVLLR